MRVLFLILTLVWFHTAAEAAYFPLQPGNQWVLQSSNSPKELLNIEVLRSMTIGDNTYYLVSGFADQDVWIRRVLGGEIYSRDMQTGIETKLAHLSSDAQSYQTALGGCTQTATPVWQPSPGSDNRLGIYYDPGGCRDVGLWREVYHESVGMVERTIVTLRGPVTYTLTYAKVGGQSVVLGSSEIVLHSDFSHGSGRWLAGFSDYSLVNGDMHFAAEPRTLPQELGAGERQGLFLQGMNRSDDMFMFVKKGYFLTDGILPNQSYSLSVDITFASNAQSNCAGVGGAPGESVYLKAGASVDEPVSFLGGGAHMELNIDKGHQSQSGVDGGVAGNIANGEECDADDPRYVRVQRHYVHPRPVRTDDRGQLWMFAGTDSAYEGLTGLFYESITVRLTPVADNSEKTQ